MLIDQYKLVKENVKAACEKAGRDPKEDRGQQDKTSVYDRGADGLRGHGFRGKQGPGNHEEI